MTKIGLFFGSTMGNTENAANLICKEIGQEIATAHNIAEASAEDLNHCDVLILGTSTWGDGELQDDWLGFIDKLDSVDFGGKKVALFGVGDQMSYPDTFVDGIGLIYDRIKDKGAEHIGRWPKDGYEFAASKAVVDGEFLGLALDDNNQSELTPQRIGKWAAQLKSELKL